VNTCAVGMGTREVEDLYFNNLSKTLPLRGYRNGRRGYYGQTVGILSESECNGQ
jgi:hypothetical protein